MSAHELGCTVNVGAGVAYTQGQAPAVVGNAIAAYLSELVLLNRELVKNSREQLELMRRAEERFQQQQQHQKEEFQRLLGEHSDLAGRCQNAQQVVRDVLGQAIVELTNFVEDQGDDLRDSEFVRADMVDRYGALLNHLSAMYGMMKRLAAVDTESGTQNTSDFTY